MLGQLTNHFWHFAAIYTISWVVMKFGGKFEKFMNLILIVNYYVMSLNNAVFQKLRIRQRLKQHQNHAFLKK